jgi:DNA-directed RNA polymerase specialized sigma subunit
MVRVSQTTKNLVNAFAKDVFGESVEETRAKEEIKEIKEEIKQMDEQRTKSIILLYTRVDMTIDEIAAHLVVNKEVVKQILVQNKVIKK